MATVEKVNVTPSGIYAEVHRGADVFPVVLSRQLPRWNALNSGTYIEISPQEWAELNAKQIS